MYPEEELTLEKDFWQSLSPDQRKAYSKLKEQIEEAVYWETRRQILDQFERKIEAGEKLKDHIAYLRSKSRPIKT